MQKQARYRFTDENGTFMMENPENNSYLYFPLAGEQGMKSSITPLLGGDAKTDQNHFLFLPVSAEDLHNSRVSRNFWCRIEDREIWSVAGASDQAAVERARGEGEKSRLEAGFLYQKMEREKKDGRLKASVLAFVPIGKWNVEIMEVTLENTGSDAIRLWPYGVLPVFGRSADNLRDHRHVTSLLHRISTTETSMLVRPVLSFDERGHQPNSTVYAVTGMEDGGKGPEGFFLSTEDFLEEGGSFTCPGAVYRGRTGKKPGAFADGMECAGAMCFSERMLSPGEKQVYILLAGIFSSEKEAADCADAFRTARGVKAALEYTCRYWQALINVRYFTGNREFNQFMRWVSLQPVLRRIYGCSFLPHHDYGRGGRGWRDLWQDCLALLLMEPDAVRALLVSNFGGVRMDGSNATIIGSAPGEFKADRNQITRVWMDHGLWPFMTMAQYIHLTGDLDVLLEENTYFKDSQVHRGTRKDPLFEEGEAPLQKTEEGGLYRGTLLEHMLVQHLTAFYEVGEHNHMRLRGADWNDALDMAPERGESVAFTAAYAGNLERLAELLENLAREKEMGTVLLAREILPLLEDSEDLNENIARKRALLEQYCSSCSHNVSGEKTAFSLGELALNLRHKSLWIKNHIQRTEWLDLEEDGWFNSYYDNHGRQVEGRFATGIRMMLTGQVFAIMSGTASREQTRKITQSADRHLFREQVGGYRLNTDFQECKMDLGRMFGFAYGHKENGAVFSHMTVMYANALYQQGFVKEGYKALKALFAQSQNFEISRIYPGIPEYFNAKGRGMYHYLTGAASWYMLTVIQEMFGVKGHYGHLHIRPCLMAEQFNTEGMAGLALQFGHLPLFILFKNIQGKEAGEYRITEAFLDGRKLSPKKEGRMLVVSRPQLELLDSQNTHQIVITLS